MHDSIFRAEYEDRRDERTQRTADHDALVILAEQMRAVCVDCGEIKALLTQQNGRIRKLEERWWIATGALLAGSTIVNWALFQLLPLILHR
jgi:hypothetical protein